VETGKLVCFDLKWNTSASSLCLWCWHIWRSGKM